ncbi:NIF3-like protein 1 isoform X3 [Cephus cinctus]|uniref:NIF3-like protein 1 n=1 Tax=Cephus cinctus TaxID=211228 RepID=A0AAJ7C6J7_CEPCN|nr:NIF3-like protein 1 isoform X3 [Cephus cinctus]XP_015603201.1 NIF3-like protein 1 isoform X3 [Cephus cinctus]XP_015603202.1 NIF3-like protein 1 isoform X3 [Cephus cinctus]
MFGRLSTVVSQIKNSTLIRRKIFLKTMSSQAGLPLQKVVEALHAFADESLAASWDNVGLLIEPTEPKNISHVLLTNDLTEAVMTEAVNMKADLIISYHPPIFAPLKSITNRTWKERIAAKCLENKIALYSPHTSFDSIKGGVNDWLAESFDLAKNVPIEPDTNNPENGIGRLCTLKQPISIMDAVQLVKERTKLPYVRLAKSGESTVQTVAICAGSGTSVLKGISADLFLTGEMLHHDVLDAVHNGTNVILTNHSDSERGFLPVFGKILQKSLGDTIKISISKEDTDPLKTV